LNQQNFLVNTFFYLRSATLSLVNGGFDILQSELTSQ